MFSYVGLIWLCLASVANAQQTAGDKVFDRLRGLSGTWEGTFEWSGGREAKGKLGATYQVTGNGSAVIEGLIMDGETVPSMTTVYHMDGPDLRMTHYCAAQNQPRLRATRIAEGNDVAQFTFVDATNVKAHPAHVEAFEIRFVSDDRVVLEFTFGGSKKSIEHIELRRVRPH